MDRDEQLIKKRFTELSDKAYRTNAYYFTDFLSMSDAALLYTVLDERDFSTYGGCDGCERVLARFGNAADFGYEQPYPITIIKVEPLLKKFADDLNHRDFLGALMNLGIERDTVGDIRIRDKIAYIFVVERIADYIMERLDQVKHTSVRCSIAQADELADIEAVHIEESEMVVSSERLDVILAKFYNLSRSQAIDLFREHKVFINGRSCENNSGVVKNGDIVAVRGYGKFLYLGISYATRKGKICVIVGKYV